MMGHLDANPLSKTLAGEAENGDIGRSSQTGQVPVGSRGTSGLVHPPG